MWWEILNICVANFISFVAIKNFFKWLRFDVVSSYTESKGGNFFETQCRKQPHRPKGAELGYASNSGL